MQLSVSKCDKVRFDNEYVKAMTIDQNTKESGGNLGYIPKRQLPSNLAACFFNVPKGTLISEPVALGDDGFSIIRVEDKRSILPPSIEEIHSQLMEAISQHEASKIVLKLREEAKVVLYDEDGNIMSI